MADEATAKKQREFIRAFPGASAYRGSVIRGSVHPGASVHPSVNVFIKTVRNKKGRIQEFSMRFDSWTDTNDTFNWYEERKQTDNGRGRYVRTMHLRKERNRPFYHEFILLHLDDDTFWRIDRRQLEDEQDPYSCIRECGVPACDTIARVSGMASFFDNNPITSRSNCIVELEFKKDVDVALILRICRAIKNHENARVYTLQRYNCYFFSQALIMCTACGVSDWAGGGESGEGEGLWKSPNVTFPNLPNLPNVFDLGNKDRLDSFRWNPSDTFVHDWGKISQLSNKLVHTSPLLRHADHCNYCLQSQTKNHQRSMSSEINRLKHRLVIYWNDTYRELLDKAFLANRKALVDSGVWLAFSKNQAEEGCKQVLADNRNDIITKWEARSQNELKELLDTVRDLLDPSEVCKAWYPDPDEWGSVWRCKDGGPVRAAMGEWEENTRAFLESEISYLEEALETQIIRVGFETHAAAMKARFDSFDKSLKIKIRVVPKPEENIEVTGAAQPADLRSIGSAAGKTMRSRLTVKTFKTMITVRAKRFKNALGHLISKYHKMDDANMSGLGQEIDRLIQIHADHVGNYSALLDCTAQQVHESMTKGMNEVWKDVIG